jgi:hypothetical protein
LETEQSFVLVLKTAFVARPTEYGPLKYDFEANGDWAHSREAIPRNRRPFGLLTNARFTAPPARREFKRSLSREREARCVHLSRFTTAYPAPQPFRQTPSLGSRGVRFSLAVRPQLCLKLAYFNNALFGSER